jgi:hypothetical protein
MKMRGATVRAMLMLALMLPGALAAMPSTASASYTEVYCSFCYLPNGTWVAHSTVFRNYDENVAGDCSSETNCGAWHTCVSMHYYNSELLYIPRACSSTGAVVQGWSYDNNFSTAITAWCENDGGAYHHQNCTAFDYG